MEVGDLNSLPSSNELTALFNSDQPIMSEPKWEDLNMDCLVNIFGRLEMESLLMTIPLVCKSWYGATKSSLCWRHLVFPPLFHQFDDDFTKRLIPEYQVSGNFSVAALVKYVVRRSNRCATMLALPFSCTEDALLYMADECPDLLVLQVRGGLLNHDPLFLNILGKWEKLESLRLGFGINLEEIITQISIHCKDFISLTVEQASIGKERASAIVFHLPKLKTLDLRYSYIEREGLVIILQGCK